MQAAAIAIDKVLTDASNKVTEQLHVDDLILVCVCESSTRWHNNENWKEKKIEWFQWIGRFNVFFFEWNEFCWFEMNGLLEKFEMGAQRRGGA